MEKLKIWMLPTLALIRQEKTVDYVVGFDDMGGKDDFSTEVNTQTSVSHSLLMTRHAVNQGIGLQRVLLRAVMRVLSVLKVHALLGCSCHTQCLDFSCTPLHVVLHRTMSAWHVQVLADRLAAAGVLHVAEAGCGRKTAAAPPRNLRKSEHSRRGDSDEDSDFD